MKKILVLLLLAGAAYKGYMTFIAGAKGAFDKNGQPLALLFVHDECGSPCAEAESLLDKRQVDYELINIADGISQAARMKSLGGDGRLPYLVAGNEHVTGYEKWDYITKLATTFDGAYLTTSESAIFARSFHDNGTPRLVMYTMDGCGYCDQARSYFQREGIAFEERNSSVDAMAKYELDRMESGTPLILYGYSRYVGWSDRVRSALEAVL